MSATPVPLSHDLAQWLWEAHGLGNYRRWEHAWGRDGDRLRLLDCPDCFSAFLSEYSVRRGIAKADWPNLRRRLLADFAPFSHDAPDPRELDICATNTPWGNRRSLFSKVAAFAWPEIRSPLDRFAAQGLIELRNARAFNLKRKGRPKESIAVFSTGADHLLSIPEITASIDTAYDATGHSSGVSQPAFRRRILDLYLMQIGGRWPAHQTSPPDRCHRP